MSRKIGVKLVLLIANWVFFFKANLFARNFRCFLNKLKKTRKKSSLLSFLNLINSNKFIFNYNSFKFNLTKVFW